ncbi:aminotransferase class V-fold PLP-dependent enzyme [Lysinibacillus sphaericus]|uniref:Acetyltransferase, GNAT family n=3 Tax=Lysinibacillus TaxID=400634 RepID=B1HT87_LYSSC|nr:MULTISPECIES: aminotransferase class V-fold PLP-dependent enzyme [Lysinibacillus]MBE5083810.1 aminotransferase class V-fold PLP-dependent enzyme [Bacillus thuringiensis]ACA39503.1 acetyltransferase, GNAT family [Lysinibacillus sphaericus C3-41]AMO34328.1 GNAT family acetyltransferase [Lysinibacillus sphaericus]AMR90559.1 GNAT family acetyltransferase [Lysinibacillus sphaericus]ANA44609.1 GNAT family acetyltransferase [Lysinibacillus sphaericus]
MYWCKIAQTNEEYEAIARLNYETFVEEIPQHEPNKQRLKIDRFHQENTYIVVYKKTELIGMVAFRDQRPFSMDEKIGKVEQFLPEEICGKICEIRLLAVKKNYRTGRVLWRLTQALNTFAYEKGYTAAVISGTTREEKLYKQMGFQQFAPAVGAKDAQFLPMVLTRDVFEHDLQRRLAKDDYTFYPGPVKQLETIGYTNLSHRSLNFKAIYERVQQQLLHLANTKHVGIIVGTGTLANEVMLAQLHAQQLGKGLILTNGEFGERLRKQAVRWSLDFDAAEQQWGTIFDYEKIASLLENGAYQWMLVVHGETSTGTCNDLESLGHLAKCYNVKLCVDSISTFGAMPFSLQDCYLATAVSGKAIGAMSGLAFVFSQYLAQSTTTLPAYLDLANYHQGAIPFTLPAVLLGNLDESLQAYPVRYAQLQQRFEALLQLPYMHFQLPTTQYPMLITIQLPETLSNLHIDLALNGLLAHGDSPYLRQRGFLQFAVIQPDFEDALVRLHEVLHYYEQITEA